MVKFLMSIFKFNFGEFEEREFKKLLRMGIIFLLLIGLYWAMKPLKDSIFKQLAGVVYQPYAKTVSLVGMVFFVAIYSKILDYFSKSKLLSFLPPLFYGSIFLAFSVFVWAFDKGKIVPSIFTVILGYIWYFVIESFGSINIALFWAFAAEITKAESANRGFPLIYAFGQFGAIILPYVLITFPIDLGIKSNALSIAIIGALLFLFIPLVNNLIKKTPKDLMVSATKEINNKVDDKKKTGFMEGLKLLLKHKYLLGIFAANFFFEFIATIFDFNFKYVAGSTYSNVEFSRYLAIYSSCVNIVSLIILLAGISKVTKRIGIGAALACLPVFVSLGILGFLTMNSLSFLFCLMVASKAINYAINGPVLKQLYIPTSKDAKSKSQAWAEIFGSRLSKQAGSTINMLYQPLGAAAYRFLTSVIGFAFVSCWFFVALFLGKTYKKAVDSDTMVC